MILTCPNCNKNIDIDTSKSLGDCSFLDEKSGCSVITLCSWKCECGCEINLDAEFTFRFIVNKKLNDTDSYKVPTVIEERRVII